MKFSEFNKKTSQASPPNPPIEIDGTFHCQECPLVAYEAEWFRNEKILRWKCPEGHFSYIEDFSL